MIRGGDTWQAKMKIQIFKSCPIHSEHSVYLYYSLLYTPPPLSSSHRGRAPAVANARWDPQGASKYINMVHTGMFFKSITISEKWFLLFFSHKPQNHFLVICTPGVTIKYILFEKSDGKMQIFSSELPRFLPSMINSTHLVLKLS